MRDWYAPSPALLVAIRTAYCAEANLAFPVAFDRLWERVCQGAMRQPDGFARLFGHEDAREAVELALVFGAVPELSLERGPWGPWIVKEKE